MLIDAHIWTLQQTTDARWMVPLTCRVQWSLVVDTCYARLWQISIEVSHLAGKLWESEYELEYYLRYICTDSGKITHERWASN